MNYFWRGEDTIQPIMLICLEVNPEKPSRAARLAIGHDVGLLVMEPLWSKFIGYRSCGSHARSLTLSASSLVAFERHPASAHFFLSL